VTAVFVASLNTNNIVAMEVIRRAATNFGAIERPENVENSMRWARVSGVTATPKRKKSLPALEGHNLALNFVHIGTT
jgi:hypothetical protein